MRDIVHPSTSSYPDSSTKTPCGYTMRPQRRPCVLCRPQTGEEGASSSFVDGLYVARFRLFLAARLPVAGSAQDLQALLDDLHRLRPASNAAPADAIMQSITYCAFLHAVIAWVAAHLSTPDGMRGLQHSLLQSDGADQLQKRMADIFRQITHQYLLVMHIQQQAASRPAAIADLLASQVCRVGLGAWSAQWASALR